MWVVTGLLAAAFFFSRGHRAEAVIVTHLDRDGGTGFVFAPSEAMDVSIERFRKNGSANIQNLIWSYGKARALLKNKFGPKRPQRNSAEGAQGTASDRGRAGG